MKLYWLEAPGHYIGAHALVVASNECGARAEFGAQLTESGVPFENHRPMTCEEIPELSNWKTADTLAFANGDY